MKRTAVLALIGMVGVTSAMAQGHVILSNYVSPYDSQIVWGANTGNVGPLNSGSTVSFQVYYGAGTVVDDSTLTAGATFDISDAFTYLGGGWYNAVLQVVPTVEEYTFQIRASGTTPNGPVDELLSRSVLWQVGAPPITSTANPADPAGIGYGLTVVAVVPEPSTFALAGLGAAALLIFRRRD